MEEEKAKEASETKHEIVKKPNWNKIGIFIGAVVIIVILLLFIFGIFKFPTNLTSKVTQQTVELEMLDLDYGIELEDGTLLDSGTNNFVIGTINSEFGFKTDKINQEIESMIEGEEKTITLEPSDAYGEYDENLVFEYERVTKENREFDVNRTNWITIEDFRSAFNEEPILDREYNAQFASWPYKVAEINESHVKLSQEPELNQEIPFGLFNYKVILITEDKIILRLEGDATTIPAPDGSYEIEIKLTNTEIITTINTEIGNIVQFENLPIARVTGIDETYLFLDGNSELAGKTIIVKITLNKRYIEKTTTGHVIKIPGAPTMQVFIMSYCPYGLQMLKGLLPVLEKFEDKANIELRFVGYTMHGQKEEDENYRMICLREEQYSKLVPYLRCFAEAGDYESCIIQVGIDKSKLDSCMVNKAAQYFEEDKALNEQYGVSGSPTTVINGQITEIWPRSPEDIKNKLCEAFSTKPNECSETLSTENPSPGFGFGTSSQGGSC